MKPRFSMPFRLTLLALLCLIALPASTQTINGFTLEHSLIPINEIHSGGPPRDGIPAIDKPHFITAKQAKFLSKKNRILGLSLHGVNKAYPISILNWHEIVNDTVQGRPIAVTFCPLCGTGIAFQATQAEKKLEFGVSGLLYNSDVLLYDRQTDSLWSQIMMQAISGPLQGTHLTPVILAHTTWQDWQKQHPDTLVLSNKTGFLRDYTRDPYLGYTTSRRLYFPPKNTDNRYHPKTWVMGVEIKGHFKAYPFTELAKTKQPMIHDTFQGQTLTINFNAKHKTATVTDAKHQQRPSLQAFWFAWVAFHPDTAVYTAP